MAPKYPAIPEPTIDPASLRDAVLSLKQAFEILSGQRGAGQDAAVTPGDFNNAVDSINSDLDTKVAKAGDTMTGHLTLPTTPASANAVRKDYVDAGDVTATAVANNKVDKGGDTMTGDLVISKAIPGFMVNKSASGGVAYIGGSMAGSTRWLARFGNSTAEGGSNAGSDFELDRYSDAGVYVDASLIISRATGAWTISGAVSASGAINAIQYNLSNRTFAYNTGANAYTALYDGSANSAILLGGSSDPGNYSRNTAHYCQTIGGGEQFWAANGTGAGRAMSISAKTIIQPNTTSLGAANVALNIGFLGGGSQYGIMLRPSSDATTQMVFCNAAGAQVGGITETSTATAYVTSSDIRLKEDFKSFDAGSIIDAIKVHDFAWKETGERAHGVAAQEVNEVFEEAVAYNEQMDWWGIDYGKFVPLLLQEIKALRERVKALEADK